MEYILRKDCNNDWHFDDVKFGSRLESYLCRRFAVLYLNTELVSNTPNFLVESAIRIKGITDSSDLGVISFLPDRRIMFLYGTHYM